MPKNASSRCKVEAIFKGGPPSVMLCGGCWRVMPRSENNHSQITTWKDNLISCIYTKRVHMQLISSIDLHSLLVCQLYGNALLNCWRLLRVLSPMCTETCSFSLFIVGDVCQSNSDFTSRPRPSVKDGLSPVPTGLWCSLYMV